uniref:protein S100-A10-like n=1 Tax=Euleptes europaea TaxID=460621 RepID=UPI002540EDDA|nr:protein S100-A10-like [Euleptes europaea]
MGISVQISLIYAQPSPGWWRRRRWQLTSLLLGQPSLQAPLSPSSCSDPPWQVPKISAKMPSQPSQLEHSMEQMLFTFHKFSGNKNYLTKEDLRQLMEKEVSGYMENQKDPMAIDRIMKCLEECRDGKVHFEGYLSLIASLSNGCNEYYMKKMKLMGKKY